MDGGCAGAAARLWQAVRQRFLLCMGRPLALPSGIVPFLAPLSPSPLVRRWRSWQAPQHFLTEWTRRDYISNLGTAASIDKHFRCFTHEAVLATLGPDCLVDITGRTNKRCHKHCLHSFNYTVKVRFDEFRAATKYRGPPPDVSLKVFFPLSFSFCFVATMFAGFFSGKLPLRGTTPAPHTDCHLLHRVARCRSCTCGA